MRTSIESARGCGYRKEGGYYLVAPEPNEPCPRLPLPLDRCPHCGQGIGPARGFTWVNPVTLFPAEIHGSMEHNNRCPLGTEEGAHVTFGGFMHLSFVNTGHRTGDRAGLIWVGGQFYPTPEDFMAEAAVMGISRRIKAPPRGFVVGEHWIYLGHRKAIDHSRIATIDELAGPLPPPDAKLPYTVIQSPVDAIRILEGTEERYSPGVVTLFKPTAIEYIVKGDETDEELEKLEKRGITPVKVIRDIDIPKEN